MSDSPVISILMPFFNTEKFILRAIQSLQDQTFSDWELIAIDDCSTDNSKKIVEAIQDKRIKVLSMEKNGGQGNCYNAGLKEAKGEFIALMDSDDISHSDRLKISLEYLKSNSDLVMVGSSKMTVFSDDADVSENVEQVRDPGLFTSETHKFKATMLLFNSIYLQPTVLIRKKLWPEIHYSTTRFAEDYELFTRAVEKGLLGDIPFELGFYRMHPGQTTQRVQNKVELIGKHVWRPLLERWGLVVSEKELELHSLLALTWRPLKKEELRPLLDWIYKLEKNFENHAHVDLKILQEMITLKLFDIMRESTSLGLSVIIIIREYQKHSGIPVSFKKIIKLTLRSLLRFGK